MPVFSLAERWFWVCPLMLPSLVWADMKGGTLIYSFAPPPKVIDTKKNDVAQDETAIALQTIESRKVDIDDSLRRRTLKKDHSL